MSFPFATFPPLGQHVALALKILTKMKIAIQFEYIHALMLRFGFYAAITSFLKHQRVAHFSMWFLMS